MAFEIEDREEFNSCIKIASSNYLEEWNSQCKQDNKPKECGLSIGLGSQLKNYRLEEFSVCAKLYR